MKQSLQKRCGWVGGFLVVAGLLLGVQARAQTCYPAPDGLVGWWPGDGNANDIASTNNGTLEAGATDDTPGINGDAFLFNGNDYVSIPDSPALHPANLTIEAWVRCDLLDTPSDNSYPGQQYIIFHQNAQFENFEGFDLAKDRRPVYIATNDTWCFEVTSTSGNNVFLESITLVQTNVWYHLAGVYGSVGGSNYIQLYVNGVLEGQTNVDFPVGYGNFPFYFATTGQSYYDHKFGGALDEIALYNRALSSNEIFSIYAAGRAAKCKEPTAVSIGLSGAQPSAALTIGGLAGQPYGIQASISLPGSTNDWVGLTNLTLSGSADVWLDPAPVSGQRFYRAIPGTISIP
jgi:Concanavalin A-like lectin/glucanases superfamily